MDDPERAARAVPAAAKTLEREQVKRGSRCGTARRRRDPAGGGGGRRPRVARSAGTRSAVAAAAPTRDTLLGPPFHIHIPRRSRQGDAGMGK